MGTCQTPEPGTKSTCGNVPVWSPHKHPPPQIYLKTHLRLSAFYIARLASDWPMDFTLPTLFVTIIYFMGGLRYSAAAFFGNLFAVFLGMLVAQSIGLLLGILFMDPKTAQVYATIISMTMVLTGGFFVVDLPDWIGWLRYLSFVYYTLGILLYVEFNGRTIYSCVSPGVGNACELTNPSNPAQRAECEPVSKCEWRGWENIYGLCANAWAIPDHRQVYTCNPPSPPYLPAPAAASSSLCSCCRPQTTKAAPSGTA